jgi:hypothetical protein
MGKAIPDRLSDLYTETQFCVAAIISIAAVIITVLHILLKDLVPLDNGTLIVLGIAVFPWLPLFVKKFKFGDSELESQTLAEKKQEGEKIAKIEPLIINALQELMSEDMVQQLSITSKPDDVRSLLKKKIESIEHDVISKEFISVDLTEFRSEIKNFPMAALTNMDDLLNAVWAALTPSVEPYTYGIQWVLRKPSGENILGVRVITGTPAGIPVTDRRTMKEMGIDPGIMLKVIKLR